MHLDKLVTDVKLQNLFARRQNQLGLLEAHAENLVVSYLQVSSRGTHDWPAGLLFQMVNPLN